MLNPPEYTVWLLDTHRASDTTLEAAAAWLDEAARVRLALLTRTPLQRRFLLARALLRHAVATHAGLAPAEIVLHERAGDAPRAVLPDGAPCEVSVAHSGDWVACATSAHAVGLDVEVIDRRRDVQAISAWAFSAAEHAWLERQHEIHAAFYRLWTGKEAVFKLCHRRGSAHHVLDVHLDVSKDALTVSSPTAHVRHFVPLPNLACSLATDRAYGDHDPACVRMLDIDMFLPVP